MDASIIHAGVAIAFGTLDKIQDFAKHFSKSFSNLSCASVDRREGGSGPVAAAFRSVTDPH
ncbi:MAG: hypothetical protein RQ826_15140, partial [Xanthomonadales bacterium]|nr:hypothetical protein [Xanthomonadales bacterium]